MVMFPGVVTVAEELLPELKLVVVNANEVDAVVPTSVTPGLILIPWLLLKLAMPTPPLNAFVVLKVCVPEVNSMSPSDAKLLI
jgi:hypothetical protein